MNEDRANTGQFLREWLAASVFVWPLVLGAWVVTWIPVGFLFNTIGQTLLGELVAWLLLLILPGALVGYIVGDAQSSIMRDTLRWWSPQWARRSAIGGLMGGVLVLALNYIFDASISDHLQWVVSMPLFVLCLSIGQWSALRHMTADAWLWIVGNLTGGIIFSSLVFINAPVMQAPWLQFVWFVVAAAAQGAVTGYVIIWLYERLRRTPDDEREYARVYVEVRSRQDRRR